MTELPGKWKKSEKSLRAVQLVFELNKSVSETIRQQASVQGLSTSDQIRTIIGLPVKKAQRPRLTVSLSTEDYRLLGHRYGLPPEDMGAIRDAIVRELLAFSASLQDAQAHESN